MINSGFLFSFCQEIASSFFICWLKWELIVQISPRVYLIWGCAEASLLLTQSPTVFQGRASSVFQGRASLMDLIRILFGIPCNTFEFLNFRYWENMGDAEDRMISVCLSVLTSISLFLANTGWGRENYCAEQIITVLGSLSHCNVAHDLPCCQ